MQYSVSVAADCGPQKVNLRFIFGSSAPALSTLLAQATAAFTYYSYKHASYAPAVHDGEPLHVSGGRTFCCNAAVVYNDGTGMWDLLDHSKQLVHDCQVYLFQPDVSDVPAEIPEPVDAAPYLVSYVPLNNAEDAARRGGSRSPRASCPATYDLQSRGGQSSPHTGATNVSRHHEYAPEDVGRRNLGAYISTACKVDTAPMHKPLDVQQYAIEKEAKPYIPVKEPVRPMELVSTAYIGAESARQSLFNSSPPHSRRSSKRLAAEDSRAVRRGSTRSAESAQHLIYVTGGTRELEREALGSYGKDGNSRGVSRSRSTASDEMPSPLPRQGYYSGGTPTVRGTSKDMIGVRDSSRYSGAAKGSHERGREVLFRNSASQPRRAGASLDAGHTGSILRDEREKFEERMHMSLDELRVSLKRDQEALARSLSTSLSMPRADNACF